MKKKLTTKTNILKRLSKEESTMFTSKIEQLLEKKLEAKKKKNDKLFLENQFKFDRLLDEATLKKTIRNFTF